jgi:hypothetical protein
MLVGIDADRYSYAKDIWYVTNPALTMCAGFVLYRASPEAGRGLRAFVIGGTVLGIFAIVPFIHQPALLMLRANDIRQELGTGDYAPVLALTVLFSCRNDFKNMLGIPRWAARVCMLICLSGMVLSFSRTIVIVGFIGLLAAVGVFARRAWLKVLIALVLSIIVIASLRLSVDVNSSDVKSTFIGKLARSFDEITVHEYFGERDRNENWRGYETARVLHEYSAFEPWRWIVGRGFGAQLDLRLWMPLGENGAPMRYVPIMHNGYMYLLFKGGAFSVSMFLVSLWTLLAIGRGSTSANEPTTLICARLMQGIAISLLFTTWVIAGAFNKVDMYPYLLSAGYLCGYLTARSAQ